MWPLVKNDLQSFIRRWYCVLFSFVFSQYKGKKRPQKCFGLICFFLAVETYIKYYQQAAKYHKAITFQDLFQSGTAPGRISLCLVTMCRFYATFMTLFQQKQDDPVSGRV